MKNDVKALIAAAIGIMLVFSVLRPDNAPSGWTSEGPRGGENLGEMSRFIFGGYVLPFEILSVVLLVALVGAILLAARERPGGEGR